MNAEIKRAQNEVAPIILMLENALRELEGIDEKVAGVHVDVAITSLCENFKIERIEEL